MEPFTNAMPNVAGKPAGDMVLLRQKIIGQGKARVCNQSCYEAKSPVCHCICGGKNHRQSERPTRINVREIFLPPIEAQKGQSREEGRHPTQMPRCDTAAGREVS